MAKDRPAKEKRQARNRARREALAARAEAARAREVEERATGAASPSADQRGFFARLLRPAPRPSAKATGGAGQTESTRPVRGRMEGPMPRDERGRVPGHRATLFALFFALSAAVLLLVVPLDRPTEIDTPTDAAEVGDDCEVRDEDREAFEEALAEGEDDPELFCYTNETAIDESGLVAVPLLLIPAAICGAAFWATTRERQATFWTVCLVLLAIYVMALNAILFLPSMVALTVSSFQSRRKEQQLAALQRGIAVDTDADEPPIDDAADPDDEPAGRDEVDGDEEPGGTVDR